MKRWVIGLLLLVVSVAAFAADSTTQLGLGTKLMERFAEILGGFENVLRKTALSLFVTLLLIENGVWGLKQLVGDGIEMGSLALKLAWNLVVWGFFAWLVLHSHEVLTAIIMTFFSLGKDATGLGPLDVTGMLSLGVNTALAIPAAADVGTFSLFTKPLVFLTALVAELLMLAAFFVTAAQLVMAQVEALVVIAAAPVLLAFGALSFTRDIATKVLSHALGTGVKILTIYILAGVMAKIGPDFSAILKASGEQLISDPSQLLEVIAVSGLMVLLAFFVPTIASAMLSGSASLSGGSAIGAAMGAAAGAAAIGAAGVGAAASAGGMAVNAAASGTGLAKALGAGFSAGTDLGKGTLGAAAHAVSEVASHGLGLAGSSIGDAVSQTRTAFAEKVDQSTGGQIAGSIEATRGGSMSAASPDGGNTSTGNTSTGNTSTGNTSTGNTSTGSTSTGATPSVATASPSNVLASPPSGSAVTGTAAPNYVPPPTNTGDASTASISGSGEAPRSTLGRMADAASSALQSTHETLTRGRENIIDDRAQVGATIDTKANYS